MTSWEGKTRGGVAGYKSFIFIIKYLGLPFAYFVLRFIVIYFLLFSPKGVRSMYLYFKKILKYNFFISIIKIIQNYYIFGQVLIDKLVVLGGFSNKFTYDFEGEEHLRAMVKDGGILLGAHIGNWEVAGHLLKRLETKINIVMFDREHQRIKNLLEKSLGKKNLNIIAIKNDFSHLFKIKEVLQNKEMVAIHGDRVFPGTKSLRCKFLGKNAFFPTGPLYLASKYGVPVSFVTAMKETNTHYHFYASCPNYYKYPGNLKKRNEKLKEMLNVYIKEMEKVIYEYPTQWFNYYDFWA
ncbi:MAG: acyltransferase [Bacteroidales bacterium]|nr:acyltransferase [Bacteroidales bacterium]